MIELFSVSNGETRREAVKRAVAALRRPGAVVLVPTETVYGLVCRAADEAAVEKIYALKHRSGSKLLAWFVADFHVLAQYGVKLSPLAEKLAERYCPGAITIICAKCGGGTVGFRIPDHELVLDILREIGEPLSSTSANRSGLPNALSAREALEMLDGDVDFAIDGGDIPLGRLASTVVDATGDKGKILRQGGLNIAPELL